MLPELHWEGKAALKDKIKNIPLRLLNFKPDLSCGDNSQNMIIHGDNLDAMKALLPLYRARVKCIYIDPPYNTGAAFENYNDNFPHSDWLNAIYPRLQLLREFLSDDGAIFISIDDTEQAYLKIICDEIFGRNNFVAECAVKRSGGRQDSKFFAVINEYLICYAKNISNFVSGEDIKLNESYPKFDKKTGRYYKTQLLRKWGSNSRRIDRPNLFYPIYYNFEKGIGSIDSGIASVDMGIGKLKKQIEIFPRLSDGNDSCWRWGKNKMQKALNENLIEFIQKDGKWVAYEKIYQPEGGESTKKFTTWIDENFSNVDSVNNIFGEKVFDYPKAVGFIEKILKMCNVDKNSIILDAYAGSGTTAHAVINLNQQDGGSRRFILIEEKAYCETITAERVKRIGGDYKYYEIGEKILEGGTINPAVTNEELAKFIWYSETQTPLEKINSAQLGIYNGAAIYLLHGETNILTQETLAQLPPFDGAKIIYGAACRIDEKFLKDKKITFRQIPQDLKLS